MMRDAKTVWGQLQALGHDFNPAKQRFKVDLGADRAQVRDGNGNTITVFARDIESYVAKGFTFLEPEKPAAEAPATVLQPDVPLVSPDIATAEPPPDPEPKAEDDDKPKHRTSTHKSGGKS